LGSYIVCPFLFTNFSQALLRKFVALYELIYWRALSVSLWKFNLSIIKFVIVSLYRWSRYIEY
jgi:hypothetical protein